MLRDCYQLLISGILSCANCAEQVVSTGLDIVDIELIERDQDGRHVEAGRHRDRTEKPGQAAEDGGRRP